MTYIPWLQAGWEVRRTSGGHLYYLDSSKSIACVCMVTIAASPGTNHTQLEDPRLQTPVRGGVAMSVRSSLMATPKK